MLAIRTDEVPDWGHQRAAITGPIAGPPAIHMPGMETIGTVVPLPAPRGRRPDQEFAGAAAERFVAPIGPVGAGAVSIRFGQGVVLLTLPPRAKRDG